MHVPTWFGGTIYGYEPTTTIRCINSYCNLHKLFNWEGGKGRIFRREQLYLVCIKLMDMEETNLVCVRARVDNKKGPLVLVIPQLDKGPLVLVI